MNAEEKLARIICKVLGGRFISSNAFGEPIKITKRTKKHERITYASINNAKVRQWTSLR